MIRSLRVLLLCAICFAPRTVFAQTQAARRDSLYRLVDGYLKAPFEFGDRVPELMDSASSNPHVNVTISPSVVPFMCKLEVTAPLAQRVKSLLLGAFLAGNMRAQLDSNVNADRPVAGVRAELDVYELTKSKIPSLKQPTLELWLELRKRGTLDAEIKRLADKPTEDC